MKDKTIKVVACYVRVSTQEQAEHGYSIEEQTERLQGYCKAMGWKVAKVYKDAGYTGANMQRPALSDLVEGADRGLFDAVVVFKLDRLSRSQKDTLTLIEDFLAHDVAFVSMTEAFDTSTPFGRATVGILSVFAQLEREQIKERMTLGKTGRAKQGKWQGGGRIPIGYEYKDGELIINEYEAMQIRMLHELYQQGKGFRAIASEMDRRGYSHKYGKWYHKSVQNVLLNTLYIGMVKHRNETFAGNHAPIIDKDTFDRTQVLYKAVRAPKNPHRGRAMLSGLLWCSHCGARYGFCGNGTKYRYYTCNSRRKISPNLIMDANCKNKSWRKEVLEDLVANEIKKLTLEPDALQNLAPKRQDKAPVILAEIEKLNRQRSRLTDLYGKELLTVEELTGKILPINEKIEKLKAELTAPAGLSQSDVTEKIRNFADAIEAGNAEQVHLLASALIDRIELDGDDVVIFWNFS